MVSVFLTNTLIKSQQAASCPEWVEHYSIECKRWKVHGLWGSCKWLGAFPMLLCWGYKKIQSMWPRNQQLTNPWCLRGRVRKAGLSYWAHMHGGTGGSTVKNLPADARDAGSIPGSERSPGGGHDNPLQYSCLGNPWGAWWATDHGVAKNHNLKRLDDSNKIV